MGSEFGGTWGGPWGFFSNNSSALVGSAFGAFWEDPEGGFIKFAAKRASKQDQTLHMEGKLYVMLYFRACPGSVSYLFEAY